ncbi:choice-of-anchor G family protein [Cryobacterium frigoriphilum]|uniref:Choice-of-anchor G family protein n=1 Tax=Cryobacterium frigoriphilum TaxID=1259150 RepID=A0A4R8ZUM1_9MICO|nr:IPT/TIG domain-containing protein [Cryobacterium frigoriphilum]TFD46207.1 choice-of-anchor G family protein [Cryobacterium frigoriphilum]
MLNSADSKSTTSMFSFLSDQPPDHPRTRRLATNHPHARLSLRLGAFTAITALFLGAGAVAATAAPGDISNAEGQYLSGSLIDQDLALVAALAGETATSDGTADQTNANNLDLTALGAVTITSPGGVQIPLDLTSAGVISQYASALADASSVGASGTVSDAGLIGTGITPAAGVAPGPLSLSLSGVVDSLGLPAASLAELADLGLTLGAISGRASQAAPAAAVGSYEIADADISFTSPALAALVGDVNTSVAALQATVNGLSVALDADLGTALGGLGVVTTNLAVSTPDLAAAVAGLTTGPLADPAFPGVTIDLTTGAVNVDLDEITALNGLPANTEILTPAVINTITANILGLVTSLTDDVEAALLAAVNGMTVVGDASVSVLGIDIPILTINTTVGALLAGDTTGVTLLNAGLTLPGGAAALVATLAAPLTLLTDAVNGLSDVVLAPTVTTLLPALEPVLSEVLTLTVNNQSTVAGVFTETALRVTVLPAAEALELNLGTGRVGVNALNVAPVATALVPDNGPETGGTPVTITGSGFFGTTDVTIDGVSVPFVVVDDGNITFTTPVHVPGVVPVVVTDPAGSTLPLDFTFTPVTVVTSVVPNTGPETGGTSVTITGSCFTGATAVLIGGTPATNVVVVNDTTITADVPAGVGVADVTVVGGGTCGTGTLPGGFTYLPAAVISAITPDNGPEAGGTTVTITGTGFTGATDVTFDGESAATVTVDSDTQITVVTAAHAPGPSDVVVLSPNGNSAPGVFTFNPLPALTSLVPDNGPETGGTAVTITGTGFTGATSVTIDAVGVPFVVVSDTEITFTTPAHAPATVPVIVTGPGGTSGALPFTFTDVPDAVITGLAPTNGPEAGGTTVIVTGTGFTDATAVTFDGLFGTGFTVDSDTQITVVTPAHAPGPADVVVLAPNGNSAPGVFTFDPLPVLTGIDPSSGPQTGGTAVTLTGSGFTGATAVTVDGVSVPFVVVSDTTITLTTVAHLPATVPVLVAGPGGVSGPLDFTFTPVTQIDVVDPPTGPEAGTNTVTLTGQCFTGATAVLFGGVAATSFVVVSDTVITAVVPAGTGVVDVTVVGAGTCGTGVIPDGYEYLPPAAALSLVPSSGPEAGGTTVVVTGTGFTGATAVTFDGLFGTGFTVDSDTQITVVTPAHAPGLVDAVVLSPNGNSAALDYTFVALPVISSLDPSSGPQTGGTAVTVTGTGFTGTTSVTVDGVSVPFVEVSDTVVTIVTPAHVPATVPVVVSTPGGASAPLDFTFTPVTQIDVVDPPTGPEAGTNTVTLTGQCFTGATAVLFGGVAATSFVVVSDTVITAVVPAGTGVVDVTVVGAGTCGTGVIPDGYEYLPPAAALSLVPDNGPEAGGTTVVVTGTGFTGATAVTFDGLAGTGFTVDSDTQITVVTPAHAPGLVDAVVESPNGDSGPLGYTYNPSAVTTSLTPDTGPETGGTPVTIAGTGFTGTTGVTIDGVTVPFVVVSDTVITFTTPAHAPGAVPVVVSGPGGASVPLPFTFTAVTTVDTIDPPFGPETGSTTVTITGTCFTVATDVLFGGVSAQSFTVISDTQITAVTPTGVGIVDVTVIGGGTCGTGVLPDGFEFVPGAFALSISPDRGGDEGGDTITITGFGFTAATSVTFGGVEATSYTVVSDTEIQAINPAYDSAAVAVVVTGPGSVAPLALSSFTGLSGGGGLLLGSVSMARTAVVSALQMALPAAPMFTYEDPIISSISPSSGPTSGGGQVSIFGVGFDSTTLVSVDGVSVAYVQVSDSLITYTAPQHAAGTVVVMVDGQSEPDQIGYTYESGPLGSPFESFLASTGLNWMPITLFGVLALLLGGALVLLRKRGLLHRP